MKKIKLLGMVLMLSVMFVPTIVDASNIYYSDSYSMFKYYDLEYVGGKSLSETHHNQRYSSASAGIYDSNGTSKTVTNVAGKTAFVSLLVVLPIHIKNGRN